jgi:hypothetical protein
MPFFSINIFLQDSLTGSEEVAVVIGIQSCPGAPCIAPADYMGQILYNGPFNPQFHEAYNPPYENFTVQIPSSIASGTALLGVAHVTLVGVSALNIVHKCSRLMTWSRLGCTLGWRL